MGAVYATVEDVIMLGRELNADETERAPALLNSASVLLRTEARKRGYDLDGMIEAESDIGEIAKTLVVNAVIRSLNTSASAGSSPAAVQASQSGLGYSASMTYLAPGQTAPFFLKSELKQMGLLKQRYGAMEVYFDGSDD